MPVYVFNRLYYGLPHSDISGSMLASSSPELFVGRHVLLRLCVPRYPPSALCSLTTLVYLQCVFHRESPNEIHLLFTDYYAVFKVRDWNLFQQSDECNTGHFAEFTPTFLVYHNFVLSVITVHWIEVGHPGLEPGTSPLSGVRSNHLS